jgi:hypothetical protein
MYFMVLGLKGVKIGIWKEAPNKQLILGQWLGMARNRNACGILNDDTFLCVKNTQSI